MALPYCASPGYAVSIGNVTLPEPDVVRVGVRAATDVQAGERQRRQRRPCWYALAIAMSIDS